MIEVSSQHLFPWARLHKNELKEDESVPSGKQDGAYLSLMSIFTLASAWLIWPKRPLAEQHTLNTSQADVCASGSPGEKS